jgi:transketolase
VVFVGSDVAPGLLAELREELPEQYFMEGIQEQHLIGMAAGLALEGLRPVVATIGTFLTRRCFEQVLVDAALHELPIVLLATGPGLAYSALGPTHCAIDDVALLRSVPGMTVVAPADMDEGRALLEQALERGMLAYFRVPRGDEPALTAAGAPELGRPVVVREGADVLLAATGRMSARAVAAAELLERDGIHAAVVHAHTVKPLGAELPELAAAAPLVVTVEEHLRSGGLGSALLEALVDAGAVPPLRRLGLPDAFVAGYGTHEQALEASGLTAGEIRRAVAQLQRSPAATRSNTAA